MTLFFSSRSSSSFVALNATAGCSVFVRMKNDVFADFRLLFPEIWMPCLCSPRMESTPKLLMSTCWPRSCLNWGRLRVRGNTILTPSQSSLNGCSLMSYPGHCWSTCWSLLAWASRSALPHRTYLQFCTHPQNQCLKEWWGISSVEVQFWMWSLISGRAANFKHRVTLIVFFRQDWCGDLPPAEEKECLEDSSGLLSLLEMLLKQHEARLVFVVVHKVMPWQSPEMKCLVSDALKRKKAPEIKSS